MRLSQWEKVQLWGCLAINLCALISSLSAIWRPVPWWSLLLWAVAFGASGMRFMELVEVLIARWAAVEEQTGE